MYHNPTHNPYHNPYHTPYEYPYWGIPRDYMDHYDNHRYLTDMYPDIYRRVYPRVQEVCHRHDVPSNRRMYPQVDPAFLEQMVDEVYGLCTQEVDAEQFGRSGIFGDLISILIIRELLGRRRRRPVYGHPGYGRPGVGYPGIGF
ncbi:hypothetical protein SAMN05660297_01758 [Natronincola peptidivorans]|uniref:Uncharacterized protein n=1 Tax=Natronincola peptidivorans TaxID=426128 RepID=A0A1I0CTE9_9FIRM|nr:hypothetical protein [Natronincola peptidivorans]SET23069.1 hypothetical protein SAMN05660297_01758 [Natronincola peptidivorans]